MENSLKLFEVYNWTSRRGGDFKVIYIGEDTKFKSKHMFVFESYLGKVSLICVKNYSLENSKIKFKGYKRRPILSRLEKIYIQSILKRELNKPIFTRIPEPI